MRWFRLFAAFLFLSFVGLGESDRAHLRLGPVRIEKPEHVEVLVELPDGVTAGASDFQLLEDGQATVRSGVLKDFRTSGWTAAVVLAVDSSGSLKKSIDNVKKALPDFVTRFQGSLALITFGDEVSVASFDTPREQIIERIAQLQAAGKETRLYEALDKSLKLLEGRPPQPERQRIIVVSDGEEESLRKPGYIDGIITRAARRRVAIDTIWIARASLSSRDTMVRLSERTDGVHGDAQDAEEIQTVLGNVMERVDRAVVVSFERKLQGASLTREVGLRINQAGVTPASMTLESPIPKSAPPTPPDGPWWKRIWAVISDLKSWWDIIKEVHSWLLKGAAAAAATYSTYSATFIYVKRHHPEEVDKFPFQPWPFDTPKPKNGTEHTVTPITSGTKGDRRTRVDHGTSANPSSGLVLEVVKGPLKGRRIAVEKEYFQIGADPGNDLCISSDTYVSGQHAAIQRSKGEWILVDRGSRNGTFVDGQKLTSGHTLQSGQSIQVGDSEFQVVLERLAKAAQGSSGGSKTPVR